ncbi:MAG: hypothetical protein IK093_05345 [Ruminiclostridium sp.]|nr:hypothetical protein [Ruminiclostridium sp.]
MIFKSKNDLYREIRNDYEMKQRSDVRGSFIYRYIKETKDKRAEANSGSAEAYDTYRNENNKRCDHYIRLRSAYLAYKNGIIPVEDYNAAAESVPAKKKKKATSNDIDEAEEQYERNLILDQIASFFSNAGVRWNKNENDEAGKNKYDTRTYSAVNDGSEKSSVYSDDILMLYKFICHTGGASGDSTASGNEYSNEYIEKCEDLFLNLSKSGKKDLLVPLAIDPSSDMGIFIVGSDYLLSEDPDPNVKRDKTCYVCTVTFGEIVTNDMYMEIYDMGLTPDLPEPDSDTGTDALFPIMSANSRFNTVREAFVCFNDIRSDTAGSAYRAYQDINYFDVSKHRGRIKIDEQFSKYFEYPGEAAARKKSAGERIRMQSAEKEQREINAVKGIESLRAKRNSK